MTVRTKSAELMITLETKIKVMIHEVIEAAATVAFPME